MSRLKTNPKSVEIKTDVSIENEIARIAANTADKNCFATIFRQSIKSRRFRNKIKPIINKDNMIRIFSLMFNNTTLVDYKITPSESRLQTVRINKTQSEEIKDISFQDQNNMVLTEAYISILENEIINESDPEKIINLLANYLLLILTGKVKNG